MEIASLNKKATIAFTKLIDHLINSEHLTIENAPYMPLTIERINEWIPTPWGKSNQYSLCHYYEQEGDLMEDPEMCFYVIDERYGLATAYDKVKIIPYMYQQAGTGTYEQSVSKVNHYAVSFDYKVQREQTDFANMWLDNIEQQGFLDHLL